MVASSGTTSARRALAQLAHADLEMSATLADDHDWHVREELAWATTHPEILERLLGDVHPQVRGMVARNPKITSSQRRALAKDPQAVTRAIVATCENCPDDILFELAQDKSANVRFCLTLHGKNRPLMELLMNDSDSTVADTARSSLSRPPLSGAELFP
ncbi:hypothetical protein [Aeromicrobium sp. UC242_57]|uniref:hypothetical protein n=1 Tax=Aeromicrobium sp. UC242_57 TaxID=3374624 RepID=UPI00379E8B6C